MDDARGDGRGFPGAMTAFSVNGDPVRVAVEPSESLAETLRDRLGLTGTKVGCNMSNCGACTVVADGCAVYACMVLTVECEGWRIETVEGLATAAELHPLQRAFIEHDALQCGFCTPGQLMSLKALWDAVSEAPARRVPDADEIERAVSGNLCRCGAYLHIVEAARAALADASGD